MSHVTNLSTVSYTTLCMCACVCACDAPTTKWIGFHRICQVHPSFFFSSHVLWPPYRHTRGRCAKRREKTYKTCYPLLRGILRLHTLLWRMGSLWIFFCNSERITHCFGGVVFFFPSGWIFMFIFLYMLDSNPFPLIWAKRTACPEAMHSKALGAVWDTWVVKLFVLQHIMMAIQDWEG